MTTVQFKNVDKIYSNQAHIVKDFNLDIEDGEFVVFLGPSGCGKSTTLRMLSGLEDISKGEILIGGQVVNDLDPKQRNIAMVFQSYALYPHMTVEQNIGFALKMEGQSKQDVQKQVRQIADMLQITPLLNRKPRSLSGGQRQRVAMGRAMVRSPDVFLFDEPLSNLDAKLRNVMRSEIKALHNKHKKTTVYVTHDQVEAMTLADKVVILRDGVIEQVGTPKEIYHNPVNQFVACFIGSPTMNMLPIKIALNSGEWLMTYQDVQTHLALDLEHSLDGSNVTLGVRPSDIHGQPFHHSVPLAVFVDNVELLGSTQQVNGRVGTTPIIIEVSSEHDVVTGQVSTFYMDSSRLHLFDEFGTAIV